MKKNYLKKWWKKVTSPTPKFYKKIRNISGGLSASFTAAIVAVNTVGVSLPEKMVTVIAISIALLAFVATWAQSHEEKGGENGKDNR